MLVTQIYMQGNYAEEENEISKNRSVCEQSVEGDSFYSITDITKFVGKYFPDKYIYTTAHI